MCGTDCPASHPQWPGSPLDVAYLLCDDWPASCPLWSCLHNENCAPSQRAGNKALELACFPLPSTWSSDLFVSPSVTTEKSPIQKAERGLGQACASTDGTLRATLCGSLIPWGFSGRKGTGPGLAEAPSPHSTCSGRRDPAPGLQKDGHRPPALAAGSHFSEGRLEACATNTGRMQV